MERAFKNKIRSKILEEIEIKPSRFKEMQEDFRNLREANKKNKMKK